MSTPRHEQVRRRRFTRLIMGIAGETGISACTQRPLQTSTVANRSSAAAPALSAFSSPTMGDDQSPVGTSEYDASKTFG